MVFIFDECHRSQFGQTHQTIKNFFPKAQLFGFTGTPIFEQNATVGERRSNALFATASINDALKQHKRGLMQQLFPAPEEN